MVAVLGISASLTGGAGREIDTRWARTLLAWSPARRLASDGARHDRPDRASDRRCRDRRRGQRVPERPDPSQHERHHRVLGWPWPAAYAAGPAGQGLVPHDRGTIRPSCSACAAPRHSAEPTGPTGPPWSGSRPLVRRHGHSGSPRASAKLDRAALVGDPSPGSSCTRGCGRYRSTCGRTRASIPVVESVWRRPDPSAPQDVTVTEPGRRLTARAGPRSRACSSRSARSRSASAGSASATSW